MDAWTAVLALSSSYSASPPRGCRGTLSPGLHEEALVCLMHIVGHLTGGLPCSTDPRVWLLDEVVICLKERKSVVQVNRFVSYVH